MTQYIIPSEDVDALEAEMPTGHTLGYLEEDMGYFLHDPDIYEGAVDLDAVWADAGLGDRAAYLSGIPTVDSKKVKIYRYLDPSVSEDHNVFCPPKDVNYISGLKDTKLVVKRQLVQGEVQVVEHYVSATIDPATGNVTYDDLVVREEHVYTRDANFFARSRMITIRWVLEDGTYHEDTKQLPKVYDNDTTITEGERRRANIIRNLIKIVAGTLVNFPSLGATEDERLDVGKEFMLVHQVAMNAYKSVSSKQLYYDLQSENNYAWLDWDVIPGITIRMLLLSELNIWGL